MTNGAYLEANFGYAFVPYKQNMGTITKADATPAGVPLSWSNGNGGYTYGGDVGYQFIDYMAVELGIFRFPKATARLTTNQLKFNQFTSWAGYGALKFIAPIFHHFAIFAKAGAGYYMVNALPLNTTAFQSKNRFVPVFGSGFDYSFDNSIMLNLSWTYFSDDSNTTAVVPHINAITAGIGYKFES